MSTNDPILAAVAEKEAAQKPKMTVGELTLMMFGRGEGQAPRDCVLSHVVENKNTGGRVPAYRRLMGTRPQHDAYPGQRLRWINAGKPEPFDEWLKEDNERSMTLLHEDGDFHER